MARSFTEGMAKAILQGEESNARFENFCCELFSEVDGWEYVPTSRTYDRGVDGRIVGIRGGEVAPVICATLRVDVIDKAKEDAVRLKEKGQGVRAIRFCSTQRLTENLLEDIKKIFKQHCPEVETIMTDGLIQIESLAAKHPVCFEKYYLAELANLRSALAVSKVDSQQVQMTGMRIALTTQLGDDACALREDLQRNLVLTSLSDCKSRTLGKICKQVSKMLHLPKTIQLGYIEQALDSLKMMRYVNESNGKYLITELGREEVKSRTEKGSGMLTEGQTLIRNLLRALTGEELEPDSFAKLWDVIQDEIANMFLANGIYIVNSIESIIKNETTVADHPDFRGAIQRLGDKVSSMDIFGPRKLTIGQAVIDMFQENTSDAFKWLGDLGAIYVSLCSLGLEETSQQQIEERLRELDLLLDTDVILSLLSPGEPKHDPVEEVVNCWKRIKGRVCVVPCVLEETSYHAWISQRDYEETWRILGKMNDSDALHLLENVFVRGFRVEARGKYQPAQWNYYIGQFRGAEAYDYRKIQEILKDYSIVTISEENIDNAFSTRVTNNLLGLIAPEGGSLDDQEIVDKCKRDGRLMAVLLRDRKQKEKVGGTVLIISSSRKLRDVCKRFKVNLGKPEPVVPIGSIAYFLSLVPGANLSFSVLRKILFDTGFPTKLHGLERRALRVVQASEEYFVPFARRGALVVKMREKINEVAEERGRKAYELEKDIVMGKKEVAEDVATIVASSVDSISKSKSEKKIEQLESKIKDLMKQK